MSAAVDRVVDRLQGLKPNGAGHTARCPAHDDSVNSLSVTEGADGRCLLFCHAGCSTMKILDALGLKLTDLFVDGGAKVRGMLPTAVYTYKDIQGAVLYEVRRYPPKDFRQFRPDPALPGQWIPNLIGVARVPYRLPDLANQKTVVIVEGEKDVDRLWALGIPATCNSGGAKKWKQPETSALRAAGCQRVIIIPDNDDPGREHAEQVAVLCKRAQMSVSVTRLEGVGPHGDVSDWLDAGHTVEELRELLERPYVVTDGAQPVELADVSSEGGFNPLGYKLSDLGNAEAFIAQFGDVVRFDQTSGRWLVWSGHTWKRNAEHDVRCLAHEHVRRWQQAAAALTNCSYDTKSTLVKFTLRLEKSGAFDAMLKEAKVKPKVSVLGGWDEHPWLLGTSSGVVDLRTGVHRDGVPADLVTHTVGVEYQPTATADRWVAFLHQIFGGDADVVDYVQRAIGYCLTGITTEQCFFMASGSGSNGKSTFLSTLDTVFGQYAHTTDIRTFTHVGDGPSFELAELVGKRLITTSETKTRSQLNEQVIKNFTGGERFEAQKKHGQPFTFMPMGKIWFAVNHQPKVGDESHGFWRRVRLVPFTQTFQGGLEDRTLGEKLKAEGPGILQWVLTGVRGWLERGLTPPGSVVQATEEYRASQDPVIEFIEDRCVVGSSDIYKIKASALYQEYAKWCKENGRDPLPGKDFAAYVKRSFTSLRAGTGVLYTGISLRADDQDRDY